MPPRADGTPRRGQEPRRGVSPDPPPADGSGRDDRARGFGGIGDARAYTPPSSPLQRYEFQEAHMGTVFRTVLYARDPSSAAHAQRAADHLHKLQPFIDEAA